MLSLKQWEPVLFFDNDSLEKQLELLNKKENNTQEDLTKLKILEYGITGEKKVLYELLNSHIGMYILHDINLKFNDLEAQIDFLIMTEKSVFVIECKNLFGNITIDSNGNFIREVNLNGKKSKTGIYNPLTQCERHIGLLKKMMYEKYGTIRKILFGNKIDTIFSPIVVLANDKTILNDYYAPKDIKAKVIRADQLVNYIKRIDSTKEHLYNEKYIKNYCESLLNYQIDSKYILSIDNEEKENLKNSNNNNIKSDLEIKEKLKKFRLEKSREENSRPYFIFNDKTLEDILEKKPATLEELFNVEGFGKYKVEKYGEEVLEIIKKNS